MNKPHPRYKVIEYPDTYSRFYSERFVSRYIEDKHSLCVQDIVIGKTTIAKCGQDCDKCCGKIIEKIK